MTIMVVREINIEMDYVVEVRTAKRLNFISLYVRITFVNFLICGLMR